MPAATATRPRTTKAPHVPVRVGGGQCLLKLDRIRQPAHPVECHFPPEAHLHLLDPPLYVRARDGGRWFETVTDRPWSSPSAKSWLFG
jgi:hypothetical protein